MVSREPDLQRAYMQYEKAKRDRLAYLPDLMEESRRQGLQEGRMEGRQEGRMEGQTEGKLSLLNELRENGLITPEAYEQELARLNAR